VCSRRGAKLWNILVGINCVFKATLILHGSSDPIPVLSSHVTQIGYDPQTFKQEKCGYKSDINTMLTYRLDIQSYITEKSNDGKLRQLR